MGHKAIKGHEKGTYKLKKGQKRDLKKPKMQKKSCYSKILITYPFFFLLTIFPARFCCQISRLLHCIAHFFHRIAPFHVGFNAILALINTFSN